MVVGSAVVVVVVVGSAVVVVVVVGSAVVVVVVVGSAVVVVVVGSAVVVVVVVGSAVVVVVVVGSAVVVVVVVFWSTMVLDTGVFGVLNSPASTTVSAAKSYPSGAEISLMIYWSLKRFLTTTSPSLFVSNSPIS